MGDYFHVNPLIYTDSNEINNMQKKDIDRDKSKHTYIKKYIESNGKLEEYNSFNFSFCDNNLKLNNNIIKPYFI